MVNITIAARQVETNTNAGNHNGSRTISHGKTNTPYSLRATNNAVTVRSIVAVFIMG
jgi:hypothetical protein